MTGFRTWLASAPSGRVGLEVGDMCIFMIHAHDSEREERDVHRRRAGEARPRCWTWVAEITAEGVGDGWFPAPIAADRQETRGSGGGGAQR